jgi:hypothetical protein
LGGYPSLNSHLLKDSNMPTAKQLAGLQVGDVVTIRATVKSVVPDCDGDFRAEANNSSVFFRPRDVETIRKSSRPSIRPGDAIMVAILVVQLITLTAMLIPHL